MQKEKLTIMSEVKEIIKMIQKMSEEEFESGLEQMIKSSSATTEEEKEKYRFAMRQLYKGNVKPQYK